MNSEAKEKLTLIIAGLAFIFLILLLGWIIATSERGTTGKLFATFSFLLLLGFMWAGSADEEAMVKLCLGSVLLVCLLVASLLDSHRIQLKNQRIKAQELRQIRNEVRAEFEQKKAHKEWLLKNKNAGSPFFRGIKPNSPADGEQQ